MVLAAVRVGLETLLLEHVGRLEERVRASVSEQVRALVYRALGVYGEA